MKNQRRPSNSSLERVNELELKLNEMEEVVEEDIKKKSFTAEENADTR